MENFRIESLEINKIGAFEHIKMDFPKKIDPDKAEIHILTGENGTGKSTVLECLAEVCKPNSGNIEQNLLINKFHNFDGFIKVSTNPPFFSTHLEFDDISGKTDLKYIIAKDIQNKIDTRFGVNYAMFAYSGYRRTHYSKTILIEGIRFDFPEALTNALNFDNSIDSDKLFQWIGTTKAQEALSLVAQKKDRAKKFKDSIETIETIIEEVTNEKIKFDLNPDSMHVNIIMRDNRLALMSLPDGLKSIISWIGDFVMRMNQVGWVNGIPIFERNFILFLDEIEVHLHPAWQRKILPVVQKLFKNAQIFISTHSPFVVGSVDGACVHKLKKGDEGFAVLDGEPTLSNDGKTFVQILSDTFDITSLFGEQNERKILRFKEIKAKILSGQKYDETEFNTLIDELGKESRALENLIGLEIRQINKTLGIDILDPHATI